MQTGNAVMLEVVAQESEALSEGNKISGVSLHASIK